MADNEEPTAESSNEDQESTEESNEADQLETGEEAADASPEQGEVESDDKDESEPFVTFGDDEDAPSSEEEQPAPAWVKELRKSHRDTVKENRELRQQLEAMQAPKNEYIHLGDKPTLESVDYDDDRYERELSDWYERKRQVDQQQAEIQQRQQAEQQEWQQKVNNYESRKRNLSFRDVDEAESVAQSFLNVTQQGLIVQGAEDPALVVYALGKNTKKLQELAAIKDPVKFAFAIAKLEGKLNVKSRKAATKPERSISGNASVSGSLDNTLDKLRAEAERTGDYTKIMEYNRKKRRSA